MAAISRFDRPAESNIINSISPIPFDQMLKVGMMKQQQQEQGLDALQKVYEDTYNIKYIPGSKDEQYVKEHVIPATQEIFNKYIQKDMGDPIVRRQAITDLNSKIDRQRVNKIQESYSGWTQHQQQKQKLALDNKLDPYEQDKSRDYDTSILGVYSGISSAYEDPTTELQRRYFAPLKDTLLKDTKGRMRVTGRGYNLEGVTDDIIQNVVDKNLATELTTPTGQRAIRNYRMRYGLSPEDVSDQEVLGLAFREAGEPFIREGLTGSPYQEWMMGDNNKQPMNPFSNASNTQGLINTDLLPVDKNTIGGLNIDKVKDITDITKQFKLDDAGNIIPDEDKYTSNWVVNSPSGAGHGTDVRRKKTEDPQKKQQEVDRISKIKNTINSIRSSNEEFQDLPDIQVLNAYTQARNAAKSVDYNTYLYDNSPKSQDIKKRISEQVIDDMGGRLLINASTGKKSGKPLNTISDVFEELDVPKEDRKKENLTVTAIVPGKNAYKATVWASDGPHDFMISTNKREQTHLYLIEQATKAANSGVVGDKTIKIGEDEYIVRTKLDKDENGNYQFISGIATKDPRKTIPGTDVRGMSLQDLESVSMSNLVNNLVR